MITPFPYIFNHDGIELEAFVIFISKQQVPVRLIKPYSGIEASLHTPAFAMHPSRHNLDANNELTEKGIQTIQLCMINAYVKSKILNANLPSLIPKVTIASMSDQRA